MNHDPQEMTAHKVAPLTGTWKLVIAFAAVLGVGTCVALGFFSAMFIVQPGTLDVLNRAGSEQDVLTGEYSKTAGHVEPENARFLAMYGNTNYYASPSSDAKRTFCLVAEPVNGGGSWRASCAPLVDGRDEVTRLSDPSGREALLVPDQFDKHDLEAGGWVSIHKNLLIGPGGLPFHPALDLKPGDNLRQQFGDSRARGLA
ncbi:hypothetical protein J7E83_01185 [Arthrobacter sp. ISL-48]|uniref:hypothetical protein n=1 Tax=Arthrobacter sp. ISL-48 TaxID=2819110 RepID=UPI001BE9DFB4|nr:hypothetical protein [Arthrobacter sp. ISL-48]MBT2530757.1 hypothetical protein [Arthrobacter sp. ISL-48]